MIAKRRRMLEPGQLPDAEVFLQDLYDGRTAESIAGPSSRESEVCHLVRQPDVFRPSVVLFVNLYSVISRSLVDQVDADVERFVVGIQDVLRP